MKKGISLIVLVITIIVMIIIAGAIIISLNSTNIISKTNTAVDAANESELKAAASLAYMNQYIKYWEAKEAGKVGAEELKPTAANLKTVPTTAEQTELGKMIAEMNANTTGKSYDIKVTDDGVEVVVTTVNN